MSHLGTSALKAHADLCVPRYNIIAYPEEIVKVNFDVLEKTFAFFSIKFSCKYCVRGKLVLK